MRVIISAGGTGGHIYPALAIINKIKEEEPDSEILYICPPVPPADIITLTISLSYFIISK